MLFFDKLAGVCNDILMQDKDLLHYIMHDREISKDNISKYKIGAFPKDLRKLYREGGLNAKELRENNILWNASNSQFSLYPIVIPIRNISGNTIAIGCRTLLNEKERKEKGIPKYRNSSYKKTAHLFGLDYAKADIRKKNIVFVVEGYFDAIMAHQKNINNVVATSGTILHPRQVAILARYTENVCILFDNDEPGRNSTKRVIGRLKNIKGVNITYMTTPDGNKDLDEYLRNGGSFCNLIKQNIQ